MKAMMVRCFQRWMPSFRLAVDGIAGRRWPVFGQCQAPRGLETLQLMTPTKVVSTHLGVD